MHPDGQRWIKALTAVNQRFIRKTNRKELEVNYNQLDLLIKGDIVLSEEVARNSYVGVKDGVIMGLYRNQPLPSATETIDATGKLVFPGIIDEHVHSYSNPREGFEHSTKAAAAGGVTTIIEMPYDAGAPTTNPENFREKIERVENEARVDIALLATLRKDGQPDVIEPLVKMGACGFKLSVFETDPDRFPRIEDNVLWEIMPMIASLGVPVGFHAENDTIIEALIAQFQAAGKTYPKAHCETRPPVTESLAVLKLLELAYWTHIQLHLYHISHPRSLELIRWYRNQGVDVSVETCPHYLILQEDQMDLLKAFAKINPPIRKKDEVEELWRAVKVGDIDMIASDHAPWPLERKQSANIFDNASGAPGVETLFSLMFSEGVIKRGLTPEKLANLLSEKPSERFKLAPKKGCISSGADADLTILDPSQQWTVRANKSESSAKWSPYEGMTVQGRVVRTILRGRTIFDGESVIAQEGTGEFVPAQRG